MTVRPLLKTLLPILAAVIALTSCSKSLPLDEREPTHPETNGGHEQNPGTPDTPDTPEPPEQDNRPGINPETQYAAVLSDPTPRYESPALSLRFGTPGVMIIHDGNITSSIIDIETGRRIDFNHLGLNPDSTLITPTLTVTGATHSVTGRLLKSTTSTSWYLLTDPTTSTHILVIPKH